MEAIAERAEETANPNNSTLNGAPPARSASAAQIAARFTSENARAMAAKAHEKRRMREEELRKAAEGERKEPITDDGYKVDRLARVRKQLERIDRMMEKETDPQRLDRLASAQYRLSEQERILAGRPLPGSHRPTRNPKRESPTSFTPTE